jgi:hypothetical protein
MTLACRPTTGVLTFANHWDHFLARAGVNRMARRVEPGLYALGQPTAETPVFVTANYTLSFDALRAALNGADAYILVLDTKGVNVWCAAGEGTFGTNELVRRVEAAGLRDVVQHRVLILPQLGAPGVAAHEVKKRTGFKVQYGPVRAADLPEYLKARQATPEMRRVRFTLADRLTVALVDILWPLPLMALIAAVLFVVGGRQSGLLAGLAVVAATLAATVLFPALLPWLPTRDFSTKGFILGGLLALPFAMVAFGSPPALGWLPVARAGMYLLAMPPAVAYLALLFTGSTTFTSRTGVRREIYTYIPIMAWMFGAGVVLAILVFAAQALGGQA